MDVWDILDKSKYTEEGIKEIEGLYSFLSDMIKAFGLLPMKQLYNYWNEASDETFYILSELVNNAQ